MASNLTSIYGGNATLMEAPGLYCTLETCDLTLAQVSYIPTLFGNALFAALFGIFLIAQIGFLIRYRTTGYSIAMFLGLLCEIIGYVGRIMLHGNPFNKDDFLMYLICLTIGPAFLSGAIYLCLARIVVVYGEGISRFRPRTYTIVFCSCDFLSLLLQAIGGAIASVADDYSTEQTGINIMLAGLSCQVVSLVIFSVLCGEFALRCYQNPQSFNMQHASLYQSKLWKSFLIGLAVATLAIFIRSVFRVAELSAGFNGPLANNEISFMILEGTMIVIATALLTILHPGICFRGAWNAANFNFRAKVVQKTVSLDSFSNSAGRSLKAERSPSANEIRVQRSDAASTETYPLQYVTSLEHQRNENASR